MSIACQAAMAIAPMSDKCRCVAIAFHLAALPSAESFLLLSDVLFLGPMVLEPITDGHH
jgi:hypothetical protein